MAAKDLTGSGVLYTDRRDFYLDPGLVKELWTDVAPFTTMLSNQETRAVPDPTFKMFEHRQPWQEQKFQLNANPASVAAAAELGSACAVNNVKGLNATVDASWLGLVCEVWDSALTTLRGNVIISVVGSTTSLKYKNISNAAIDAAEDDWFIVVGNAHGEGGYAPEAWADELKVVYNSTQIFKTSLEVTGTLLQASLRGESSELARLRLQKSQEHKIHKERAFLFGQRYGGTGLGESAFADGLIGADVDETFADGGVTGAATATDGTGGSGTGLVRTTYGILPAIIAYGNSTTTHDNQNYFSITEATYSYNDFVDDMEKIFQYVPTSGVKRAFCGAGALGYWSKMAGTTGMPGASGWAVNLGDMKRDALGFNYRVLETPHGMLQLVPTPVMRGPWNKSMLVVDDENLFHAQYRSSMYQTNIKTDNAYDGVKDQYFSDEGIGITNINSHSLIKIS